MFLGSELLTVFKNTLDLRYSLIPHLYALMLNSSRNATIIQPLFFSFPNDTNLFNNSNLTSNEFMVGDNILVTPIIEQSTNSSSFYFPSANWY